MAKEPVEVFPFVRFNLPRLGNPNDPNFKDFRPKIVPADQPLPKPPVAEESELPKSHSSATISVVPSETASGETGTNGQTPSLQPNGEIPVDAAKGFLPPVEDSSPPMISPQPGGEWPPAEPTGQIRLGGPPLSQTPSTPSEGNA